MLVKWNEKPEKPFDLRQKHVPLRVFKKMEAIVLVHEYLKKQKDNGSLIIRWKEIFDGSYFVKY